MKRDIPNKLRERQANQRFETIKKVNDAIDVLEMQQAKVTKKALMELTGLSSATFSKKHIIAVLQKRGVCQFTSIKKVNYKSFNYTQDELAQIIKLEKRILKLESLLVQKDVKLSSLKAEFIDLERKYELALGTIHELHKKLEYSV